jgi:NADP-dependent 3-hydroxy acid dehydrogenase YdfG
MHPFDSGRIGMRCYTALKLRGDGMSGRVEGKIALVTGGAMGLGKADCLRLAQEGAKVIVTDIDVGRAGEVADAIGGEAFEHNVSDEARLLNGIVLPVENGLQIRPHH